MQRVESSGLAGVEDSSQCSDIDNLDDAEMDDEIEAFERSLKTDWEVCYEPPTTNPTPPNPTPIL